MPTALATVWRRAGFGRAGNAPSETSPKHSPPYGCLGQMTVLRIRINWLSGGAVTPPSARPDNMAKEPRIDQLNASLDQAWRTLERCTSLIMELQLDPPENVRRIGQALAAITEIQLAIYVIRPDLTPERMKKEWNRPAEVEPDSSLTDLPPEN